VQALLEGTLGVQRAATTVLGLSGSGEAVRPLALALADGELRDDAVAALVAVGAAAVEGLVALAPDLEGRLRADVYRLLPRLGPPAADPRVQPLLAGALGDEDADAASGAAYALGELGGRESLPHLSRALEREGEVARAAAAALGRLGGRHYDEVRMLVQTRGLDGPAAPHLCRVLGACGRAEDVPFLRAALGGSSPAVRRAAAEALAQLPGTHEGDDALLFALADESAEVRAAAARALGAHAGPQSGRVIDALSRAARDAEVAVRGAAARAIGQVARAAAEPDRARAHAVTRQLAEAPDPIAAVPALEALGLIGDAADDARLIAALDSTDAEIVKVAARALGRRSSPPGSAAAREALDRVLSDRRWDVRRAAAQALGDHGTAALPLLVARRTVERDALVLEAIDVALGRAPARE
jgi:HEAT repeat protein